MPIIDMPVDLLLKHIAQGRRRRAGASVPEGPQLSVQELVELLPRLGCELEEVATVRQFACRVCGKIYDRTEAQGMPLHCTSCGADFRARPESLGELGAAEVLRLNMLAVRPDIFDPGGMGRYIRGFLGIETGLLEYAVSAPRLRVQVDPRLAEDSSYRPFIACAVLRDVRLDHATIKMVMNLQEDLHWALGRDRKLASIGVYDLDTLRGEVFHYDSVDPDELRFVPLGFSPADPAALMTPREILARHKTGQAYGHLLAPLERYPLLRDGVGTVLSMPPIINSEGTRVTERTQNFFIDVTGLSQRTVDRALNIIVTSFLELLPDAVLESVVIEHAGRDGRSGPPGTTRSASPAGSGTPSGEVRITPDLTPTQMSLSVAEAAAAVGAEWNAAVLAELLESMGHAVEAEPAPRRARKGATEETGHAEALRVFVAAYRNDVMHPIDLVEDAAIAHGYENLVPRLVPTFTVGRPQEIEEHSAVARRILTGLGFHQVMTLVLTSEGATFDKWRLPPGEPVGEALRARAVRVAHPISVEQTMCRVSMLPALLETLAINKQYDLPQQLFEVGDCCFVDPQAETGAREERYVAAAIIGTRVGYADVRAVADAFVHEMDRKLDVRPVEHPSFIAGRAAGLVAPSGERIGTLGEVHPEVLENYGLRHPVAVMELSLARLVDAVG